MTANPEEMEELLERYSDRLRDYKHRFNPMFGKISYELKVRVDGLRLRIEKYALYHRNEELRHLNDSTQALRDITEIRRDLERIASQLKELEKIDRLGRNL